MNAETIMLIVWASILILALVVEAFTAEMVSLWFAIGAAVALVFNYLPIGCPWWGQLLIFVGVSALCFLLLRPLAKKALQRKIHATNVDEMIGARGVMTVKATALDYGEVKVNGVLWTAVCYQDEPLEHGDVVPVKEIKGNKLIVAKIADPTQKK